LVALDCENHYHLAMSSVAAPDPRPETYALPDVAVGRSGRVRRLHGDAGLVERLLEQGLTVGTEVRVLRRGLFRGSVQLSLRGYILSLESSVAACVELALL
jgi:Fe2+ transport system protein FeoA